MTINELKQYVVVNRKRLAPCENDSVDARLHGKVEKDIKRIVKTDKLARVFSMLYAKDMFAYSEMSLAFYVIACLPFLIFLLPFNGGEPIIYESFKYKITIGNFGWILYILTVLMLVSNTIWRQAKGRGQFVVSTVLRYALLIACAYFGGIKNITLFGSEFSWFFVALFGGLLITLGARIIDSIRIKKASDEYDTAVRTLNSTASLIRQSANEFESLGDKRAAELREMYPGVSLSRREAWYDFKRRYNSRNILEFPKCRSVETDFTKPFRESSITSNNSDSQRDIDTTVDIEVYSQEFGYVDISAEKAGELLRSSRIFPFFNFEVPELSSELKYELFRHSWHYVKTTSRKGELYKTREVDSEGQKVFDRIEDINEMELIRKTGKNLDQLEMEMPETVGRYKARRAKIRESIGSKTEHYTEKVSGSYSEESIGDEIGVLIVRTPSGELLGLYCGDSEQSIRFAERIAVDETDFEYSPTMTSNGNTQKAFLYERFSKVKS